MSTEIPKERGDKSRRSIISLKTIFTAIAVLVILVVVFPGFQTVSAGNRGVILQFGKPIGVANEGLYVWVPWWTQNVAIVPVQTLKFQDPHADAASKDLQQVQTQVAVNYHLDPSRVQEIYTTLNYGWEDRVIRPNLEEVVKATTAKYTAEEVISDRATVQAEIFDALSSRTKPYGLIIEAINVIDFQFSASFTKAIEDKVTAEQQALREKNVLQMIQIQAQQRVAEATGLANSQVIQAQGNANATIINAEGQAKALQILRSQITGELLQYQSIQKWDGKLPIVLSTKDGIPFIINLGNITSTQRDGTTTMTDLNSTIGGK